MELRIHAKLAIKSLEVPALNLWYYCRGLDANGSGRVVLGKSDLANMQRSRMTIWRWLNDVNLFRCYRYEPKTKTYIVYLNSLFKVAKTLDVKSLGGIGWSDTADRLAEQAALIEAIKIQQQSAWLAEKCETGYKTIKPEEYFDSEGNPLSHISRGSRAARRCKIKDFIEFNGRRIALLTKTPTTYGASLSGIAKSLDVCRTTIGKLLSTASRMQLAQNVSWNYFWRAKFEQQEAMGQEAESGFFFCANKLPLKLLPYRYYPVYQLCSQKKLRGKLNALVISQDII